MVATKVRYEPAMTVEATAAGHTPPIWKESLWPVDWLALRLSPVYYGIGVPRGNGSPVVLVPGFMTGDVSMSEMYMWLARIGYRPYLPGIALNVECPGRTAKMVMKAMERAHRETGRKVHVIGHSLGGMLGRTACLRRPEIVQQLIYLGSPVRAAHAHPMIVTAAAALQAVREIVSGRQEDCLTDNCKCGFSHDLARPLPRHVRHAAIYTRMDGVVDWHDAQERDSRRNHEVGGTHVGLIFNPRTYRVLANLLAPPTKG